MVLRFAAQLIFAGTYDVFAEDGFTGKDDSIPALTAVKTYPHVHLECRSSVQWRIESGRRRRRDQNEIAVRANQMITCGRRAYRRRRYPVNDSAGINDVLFRW